MAADCCSSLELLLMWRRFAADRVMEVRFYSDKNEGDLSEVYKIEYYLLTVSMYVSIIRCLN